VGALAALVASAAEDVGGVFLGVALHAATTLNVNVDDDVGVGVVEDPRELVLGLGHRR
jgi:hypothetical protein